MLVSMNISDLFGQGNPDGEEGVLWLGEEQNTSYTSDKSSSRASKMTFLIVGIVALSAVASLGIGYLAGGQGSGAGLVVSSIPMTHPTSSLVTAGVGAASSSTGSIPSGGEVVGDSSVHTYFLPWCKQTAQISKAHTVWFATEQAAKSAGYAAGKACSGI
jgi:hypothetical protein